MGLGDGQFPAGIALLALRVNEKFIQSKFQPPSIPVS
jgi:hypothetical protein